MTISELPKLTPYSVDKLERLDELSEPQPEVDIIYFLTHGPPYMSESLTPFQSLVMKLYYGLWHKYPFDGEELKLLSVLKDKWGLAYDLSDPNRWIEVLLLAIGRRGTKTTTISFILSYEAYKLIRKGNPQKHYGTRSKHPIRVVQCASSGDQAKDVFELTKNNLKDCDFFAEYLDYSKDTMSEIRIFSPYDIEVNQGIDQWNRTKRKPTEIKRQSRPGSIIIECITTSAKSHRGGAIICMVFDEFAHFMRAKYSGDVAGEAELLAESAQTDYGMYKAMTPSTTDFGEDGKIIAISSPAEKGGKFYELCCLGGTIDQEAEKGFVSNPHYMFLQLSTWEANPFIKEDNLQNKKEEDPIGFEMEYGAHFGNPSATAIDPAVFAGLVLPNMPILLKGKPQHDYIICVDPAKGTTADTYAIGWGHSTPKKHDETIFDYWVDGYQGFAGTTEYKSGQVFVSIVDSEEVLEWLVNTLIRNLGRNNILEICYDQWNSMSAINRLETVGLPAMETYFSDKYKDAMYKDFISELNLNNVHMYQLDDSGHDDIWVKKAKEELKHLQRDIRGGKTLYHHPQSGPVQTDDFADVTANLVYRLKLKDYPTAAKLKERRLKVKQSGLVGAAPAPIKLRRRTSPLAGSSFPGYGGVNRGGQPRINPSRIR